MRVSKYFTFCFSFIFCKKNAVITKASSYPHFNSLSFLKSRYYIKTAVYHNNIYISRLSLFTSLSTQYEIVLFSHSINGILMYVLH